MHATRVRATVWSIAILLSLIAVSAALMRTLLALHIGPEYDRIAVSLFYGTVTADDVDDQQAMKLRYEHYSGAILTHVISGGLFLAVALLQFSRRFRARHIRWHRRIGRVLVACAAVAALSGLWFGVIVPYAGAGEVSSIGLFGFLLLIALIMAVRAIRRGDVARHREWMIRAFALCAAAATVRLVAVPIELFTHMRLRPLMAYSFWAGWSIILVAAESWIRMTRLRQIESAAGSGGAPVVVSGTV